MELYALFNQINSKRYVGQTRIGVKERWKRHQWDARQTKTAAYPLYRAIRKYGPESFEIFWLGEATTQPEIDNLEKLWIILLQSTKNAQGYNVREGGHRGKNSPETRLKISKAQLGRTTWNRGIPMRPETKEKLVHTFFQPGHQVCVGRKLSEETKAKIGAASKGRWIGKKHSAESIQKMIEARKKWHAAHGRAVN